MVRKLVWRLNGWTLDADKGGKVSLHCTITWKMGKPSKRNKLDSAMSKCRSRFKFSQFGNPQ